MTAACACPTCGAPLPDVPVDAVCLALPPIAAMAVRVIARRPGVTGWEIAREIYARVPDGGPHYAPQVISIALRKARPTLAAWGLRVTARTWRGHRLEKLQ